MFASVVGCQVTPCRQSNSVTNRCFARCGLWWSLFVPLSVCHLWMQANLKICVCVRVEKSKLGEPRSLESVGVQCCSTNGLVECCEVRGSPSKFCTRLGGCCRQCMLEVETFVASRVESMPRGCQRVSPRGKVWPWCWLSVTVVT